MQYTVEVLLGFPPSPLEIYILGLIVLIRIYKMEDSFVEIKVVTEIGEFMIGGILPFGVEILDEGVHEI